jgi:hypothetical protein
LVAYSVYVVVTVGVTVALVSRTAPGPGETMTYPPPEVVHERVTLPPDETCVADAVKALIVGADPVG